MPGPGRTLAFLPPAPLEARLPGSGRPTQAWRRLERALDRLCGEHSNPLRQLGGLGFGLFWLIALSGAWLYVFYETSVEGAWASVDWLTHEQWWGGGLMRSLHRYASDALVVDLIREASRAGSRSATRPRRAYQHDDRAEVPFPFPGAGAPQAKPAT